MLCVVSSAVGLQHTHSFCAFGRGGGVRHFERALPTVVCHSSDPRGLTKTIRRFPWCVRMVGLPFLSSSVCAKCNKYIIQQKNRNNISLFCLFISSFHRSNRWFLFFSVSFLPSIPSKDRITPQNRRVCILGCSTNRCWTAAAIRLLPLSNSLLPCANVVVFYHTHGGRL